MWSSYFLAGEPAWGVSCLANESRSLLTNRKLTNLAVLKTVAVATTAMTVSHLLHVKRTLIDLRFKLNLFYTKIKIRFFKKTIPDIYKPTKYMPPILDWPMHKAVKDKIL